MNTNGVDGPRATPRPAEPKRTETPAAPPTPPKTTGTPTPPKASGTPTPPTATEVPTPPPDKYAGTATPPDYKAIGNEWKPGLVDGIRDIAMKGGKALGGVWDKLTRAVQGAPPPGDTQKLKDINDFLAKSPSGAEALKYIKDNNIPVTFANGGGSYWDGNKIVIDRSQDAQTAGLTVVHEVNHARADRTGKSGNVNLQSHDDYVKTMIDEESVGTVASIEAKRELQKAGVDVKASFPLETEYNEAYDAAVAKAKTDNPKATAAELDTIGRKAGLDRVREGFVNGEVVTSTNGQTYPEYYGGYWNNVHGTGNQPAPSRPPLPLIQ